MSSTEDVVKVEVRILHANGLKVADKYSSDPYVVLNVGSKKVGKTKKKKKTLDPIWDETFSFKWKKSEDLTLNLFDSDHFSRDDFLGIVTVRYSDARMSAGRSRTYKLFPRKAKDKDISGSITVLFSFGSVSYTKDCMLTKIEKMSKQQGDNCKVRIFAANNLKETDIAGKIDPYAVIKCGHVQRKTRISEGNNPIWDFETEIEWHNASPLVMEIRDFDRLSSYDFLGFCRISSETAKSYGGKRVKVVLEGRSSNDQDITGDVEVQFLFDGMEDEPMRVSVAELEDGIFGASLEKLNQLTGELIPNVVSDCFRFLIHSGLDRRGIFRLCGDLNELKELKQMYKTPTTSIDLEKDCAGYNPDSVASLLKRFFFELPNPLIDFESFDKMLDAYATFAKDDDQKQFDKQLTQITVEMKKIHLYPFMLMSYFLNKVATFSETNMMHLSNLAVCFGPTLSRTEEIRQDVMLEQLDRKIVERLLTIFPHIVQALSEEDKVFLGNFKAKFKLTLTF